VFFFSLPVLVIALTGCMMNSSLTGVANGPDELSNVIYPIMLYLSSPAVFWQEMHAIGLAFQQLGMDAVWSLLAEIYAYGGAVDVRRQAYDIRNEIDGDVGHTFGVFMAAVGLAVTPPLTALVHTFWAIWPTSPFDNKYGIARMGELQYVEKTDDTHNPFAGYAALYEESDEQKAYKQQRKAAELKSLYQSRVLKNSG
jgi:hypothetical protein